MDLIREFKKSEKIEDYFTELIKSVSHKFDSRKFLIFIYQEETESFIEFHIKSPDNPCFFTISDIEWDCFIEHDYLIKNDIENCELNHIKLIPFLSEFQHPLIIPCGMKSKKIGVIFFDLVDYDTFNRMDEQLKKNQLAAMILTFQNVVLQNETERKISNLTTLYEISKNVPQILTDGDSFKSLVKLTSNLLNPQFVGLYLRRKSESKLYLQNYMGESSRDIFKDYDEDSILGAVLSSGKPVLTHHHEFKSFLAIPVKTASQVIGVLVAGTHNSYAYNEDDVITLKILSSQFATINLLTSTVKQMKTLTDYILDSLTSGIVTVDTHGRIESYNKTAASIFSILNVDIIKFDFRKIFNVFPEMVKFFDESKGFLDNREITISSVDKETHLLLNIFPVKDKNNNLLGKTVFFKDITDIKILKQELFRAEKLSSLGKMAAGIAHEIRNPLTGIRMVIQLLGDELGEEREEFEHVRIVLDEVDRLESLITDMLAFAKPREPKFEKININQFLEDLYSFVKSELKNNEIDFRFNVNSFDPVYLIVDKMQLKQIFLNLIKNSVQAIIKRREEGPCFDAKIKLNVSTYTDSEIIINFIDNGAGINTLNLDKVFNPFYTSKDKGTGLGLSITQRLIEDNNGKIFVESEENCETVFSIVLEKFKETLL